MNSRRVDGNNATRNSSSEKQHDTYSGRKDSDDNSCSNKDGDANVSESKCGGHPLFQGENIQPEKAAEMKAFESAGVGGKLLFTWLNPVINLCMSRSVRAEELPPLGPSDSVAYWAEAIDKNLAKEEARAAAAAVKAAKKHAAAVAKKRRRQAIQAKKETTLREGRPATEGDVASKAGDRDRGAATRKTPDLATLARAGTEKTDAAIITQDEDVAAAAVYKPSLLRALWATFRKTLLWTLTVYILRDALGLLNTYFLKELLQPPGGDPDRWRHTLLVGLSISLVQLAQIFVDTAVDFYACRIYMRVEICLLTALFKRILHPDPFLPPAAVIKGVPPGPAAADAGAPDSSTEQQTSRELQEQGSQLGTRQPKDSKEDQCLVHQKRSGGEEALPKQQGERQEKRFQHDETPDAFSSSATATPKGKRGDLEGFKGNVFNLMFIDVPSVASVIFTFLDISLLPVRLTFAALMLYSQVGLEAELPGLAVVLGTTALTILLEIGNARMKTAYMRYRDVRLDKSHEMLTYMKTVRLMGWEDIAEARIRYWRQLEMRQRSKRMYISAVSSWLSTSAAMAMSVATFVSYSLPLLHKESFRLRPELAIPVIHLLDNFIGPITDFPYAVSNTIEGLISLDRLQQCFFSPILQKLPALIMPPLPGSQTYPTPHQVPPGRSESSSRERAVNETKEQAEMQRLIPGANIPPPSRSSRAPAGAAEAEQETETLLATSDERQAPEEAEEGQKENQNETYEKERDVTTGKESQKKEEEKTEGGMRIPPDIAHEAQLLLDVLKTFPSTEIYFSHVSFAWLPHTLSPFSSLANLTTQAPSIYCKPKDERRRQQQASEKRHIRGLSPARSVASESVPGGGSEASADSRGNASPTGTLIMSSLPQERHHSRVLLRPSLLALLPADAPLSSPKDERLPVPLRPPPLGVSTAATIDNVSLHVSRGELLLVMGLPGSGKSSLLHAILQQRQLLLLSGCSFIRSAFCLNFPKDGDATTFAGESNSSRPRSEEKEGLQQQQQQHQLDSNLTQGNHQQQATTTDSMEERRNCSPGLQSVSEASHISSNADNEEAESEDEREIAALLARAETDAAVPIGYVSQEPWLQVGTVRENIMFGSAADEALYAEVVRAFDLQQDFRSWPGGDSRFIDEGGTDLSGGQRMRIAMARAVYVCLAYRRRAAAHGTIIRQQLRWRERQLEQQLRAVAAAAETAEGMDPQQQWRFVDQVREQQQQQREKEGEKRSTKAGEGLKQEGSAATACEDEHGTRKRSSREQEAVTAPVEGRDTATAERHDTAVPATDVPSGSRAAVQSHGTEEGPKACKEVSKSTAKVGEDAQADIAALPYLFCFDEAFSSLDPGVAERVFRNLFGRQGLLRNAAVVLATSEQSLFALLSHIYSEEDRFDKEQEEKKHQQQAHLAHEDTSAEQRRQGEKTAAAGAVPEESFKEGAQGGREDQGGGRAGSATATAPSGGEQVASGELGDIAQPPAAGPPAGPSAAEESATTELENVAAEGPGRPGSAANLRESSRREQAANRREEDVTGQRMNMSVCCIDRGRVLWKGSVEEFRMRSSAGLPQPIQAAAAAVISPEEQTGRAGTVMKDEPESSQTLLEERGLLSPREQASTVAERESDAAMASAAVSASSTIESILSFLPVRSQDETELAAAQEDQRQEEERRKHAIGKKEADELLKNMMVHEQAASGQVGWSSYMWYLRATGMFLSLLFVCLLLLTAFTDFASDVWIAQWTGLSPSARRTRAAKNVGARKESPNVEGPVGLLGEERKMREAETQAAGALAVHRDVQGEKKSFPRPPEEARATNALYLWFYVGLASANIFLELLIKILETRGSLQAAQRIHDMLLHVICNAPLWFYDQNPIGRVVNRLSTDVAVLDSGIFKRMGLALTAFFSCIFALLVLGFTTLWTLPLLPFLLLGVYFLVFRYYRSTCREVQRASLISFSPLCSSFSECLSGREVIFALRREHVFAARNAEQVELAQRAKLMHWAVSAWASIRLQLLSFPLALVNAIGPRIVGQQQPGINGGRAGKDFFSIIREQKRSRQQRLGYLGLAVSYSLSIASALRRMMHHFTHLEKEMCSLERIHEYAAETEPPSLRRLAEVPGSPSLPAATEEQQKVREEAAAAAAKEEEEAAAAGEAELKRQTETGVGLQLLEVHRPASSAEEAGAVGVETRLRKVFTGRGDEEGERREEEMPGAVGAADEEEEGALTPALPARRGVVLEGVEVRYRRAGFQYVSQLRMAVELALQQLRTEKLLQQKKQRQQKHQEHHVVSTADETLALLLHAPGTTAASDDKTQSEEERLLMILDGIGEGEQSVFLSPSLRIDYAAAGPTEHIGVVGRTGSGKTTLLQTLSGVLRCSRGFVKIDGMDISVLPPELLREIIGVLPQRPIVLSGMTVRDVVDPRGRHDDEAVWRALDRVGISRLIRGLDSSNQLYTLVHPTDAAAQQLPAETRTISVSSSSSSNRSISRSSSSVSTSTWAREGSQSGEATRSHEGPVERERHPVAQCEPSPRASSKPLTNCQLRYLALARLILQAPTFRLLLVDEPPADALDEAYEPSTTPGTALAERRLNADGAAAASSEDTFGAPSPVLRSLSSVIRSNRRGAIEQQGARVEDSTVTVGKPAGAGRRRQRHRFVFTPIPELLKRLFGHCTVFIVAHHVDSLQACDTVWLLWRGRIIGQCKPTDIRTDRQLADVMKKAVRSWKRAQKVASGGKL